MDDKVLYVVDTLTVINNNVFSQHYLLLEYQDILFIKTVNTGKSFLTQAPLVQLRVTLIPIGLTSGAHRKEVTNLQPN